MRKIEFFFDEKKKHTHYCVGTSWGGSLEDAGVLDTTLVSPPDTGGHFNA